MVSAPFARDHSLGGVAVLPAVPSRLLESLLTGDAQDVLLDESGQDDDLAADCDEVQPRDFATLGPVPGRPA
jgi:hypothetical protein